MKIVDYWVILVVWPKIGKWLKQPKMVFFPFVKSFSGMGKSFLGKFVTHNESDGVIFYFYCIFFKKRLRWWLWEANLS